jgi:hypothetical protein
MQFTQRALVYKSLYQLSASCRSLKRPLLYQSPLRRTFHVYRRQPAIFNGRRMYGTGASFIPRGFFFRAFWTGATATAGYIYYQINQASSWMAEKAATLRELGMGSILGFLDIWENASVSLEEQKLWNPLAWKRKTKTSNGKVYDNTFDQI